MTAILAVVLVVLVTATILGGGAANLLLGGFIALILFHPQAQELREVTWQLMDVGGKEISRAASDAILGTEKK